MPIDMFQIGLGALNAAQSNLTTTSHNISNVNTDGYSRQRVEQTTTESQFFGGNYQGTGTQVSNINRIYNQFAYNEVVVSQSQHKYQQSRLELLSRMDKLLSDGGDFVQGAMDGYYEAVNAVADSPNDEGLRSIMLSKAEQVDNALSTVYSGLDIQQKTLNDEIDFTTRRVAQISEEIAELNQNIMVAKAAGGNDPNDMLDKRNNLLKELAEYTDVSTVPDPSGGLSVLIGKSLMVVANTTAFPLTTAQGNPDATNLDLMVQMGSNLLEVDGGSLGGKLGALFTVRDQELYQAKGELDIIAMGFADTMNRLQHDGLDLDGNVGVDMFNNINATAAQESRVLYDRDNTGDLVGRINITDMSALKAQDYEINFNGTDYILRDPKGIIADINLGSPGSGTYAVSSLGFEFIETSGTPGNGDSLIIRSFNLGVDRMEVMMQNPRTIAAASPVEIQADPKNISNGVVSVKDISDPGAAKALAPLRVEVLENPAGSGNYSYNVFDGSNNSVVGGAQSYTPPAQSIVLGGGALTIEIAGEPSGDPTFGPEIFNIVDAFGVGNSTNINRIGATQLQKLLAGKTESFQQSYSDIMSRVGANTADAELSESVTSDILTAAEERFEKSSGVNLDEEAANLLRFQQGYQAASRIISVARDTFDVLFQAT